MQKYFEGETTLREEQLLSEYFRQEQLPEELMPYREWFAGLRREANIASGGLAGSADHFITAAVSGDSGGSRMEPGDPIFTGAGLKAMILEREHRQRGRVRSMRYTLMGIAASLLVAMGTLFWYQQQPDYRDTFDDPEEAMVVAGETLAFVSTKYNKGVEKLAALEKLSESVQPARKHLETLKKGFEKTGIND